MESAYPGNPTKLQEPTVTIDSAQAMIVSPSRIQLKISKGGGEVSDGGGDVAAFVPYDPLLARSHFDGAEIAQPHGLSFRFREVLLL